MKTKEITKKYIKLIEKKKSYRDIYFGYVNEEDDYSWDITYCSKAHEQININSFSKEDFDSTIIDRDTLLNHFRVVMLYRERKHDQAKFDFEDEDKYFSIMQERFNMALKK